MKMRNLPQPFKKLRLFSLILSALPLLLAGCAEEKKKEEEFLISIYGPPPARLFNDEQYKTIKDAHVDIIFNIGTPGLSADREGNLETLDMAQKHGLKVYVFDSRIGQGDEKIAEMVNDFKDHPALAGYYITDEPDTSRLRSAVELMLKVKRLDPAKDAYINHLPDWAIDGKEDYEHSFMKRYIEGAGKENIEYIAFDNYPFKRGNRLEKTYFNNLEIIRRVGLKYDLKTSSCLQSFGMGFNGVVELRRPNADELRMNVYSNLAYGIKNAVWYPYYTRDNPSEELRMYKSIIDSVGVKTDMYEPFRQLNSEMKQLGRTLIQLDAREVYHCGDSLWTGTQPPPADFIARLTDKKAEVILTRLTDKYSKKEYLMVTNRSFLKPSQLEVHLTAPVKEVMEISKTDGNPHKAAYDNAGKTITIELLPGEGRLYRLDE